MTAHCWALEVVAGCGVVCAMDKGSTPYLLSLEAEIGSSKLPGSSHQCVRGFRRVSCQSGLSDDCGRHSIAHSAASVIPAPVQVCNRALTLQSGAQPAVKNGDARSTVSHRPTFNRSSPIFTLFCPIVNAACFLEILEVARTVCLIEPVFVDIVYHFSI